MSSDEIQKNITQLYKIVNNLEQLYPGRHFTPDGHMVGSIGECLVADRYGLKLMPASNKGFDAVTPDGLEIEIKATQKSRVAFRHPSQHVIVIKINPDGGFIEIYNGPGKLIWDQFEGKNKPTNGQYSISISRLKELDQSVKEAQRLKEPIV